MTLAIKYVFSETLTSVIKTLCFQRPPRVQEMLLHRILSCFFLSISEKTLGKEYPGFAKDHSAIDLFQLKHAVKSHIKFDRLIL